MKLRHVLILHKKSTFQIQAIEHEEANFIKLLAQEHESVKRVKIAHSEHVATLYKLEQELTQRKISFRSLARAELTEQLVTDVDLIITVGGDGTFLDASHHVRDIPLLGINSSSSSSFGHFCLATLPTITKTLDDIQSGSIELEKLVRLELIINGVVMPDLVLNEALVAHSHPAATSRYFIGTHSAKEEQRSSGIWVGTPAGSTGSLRSAGAPVLPITDSQFEFVVREPCMRPGEDWKLLKGVLDHSDEIVVVSQMRTGSVYIDGQHIEHHFGIGDELIVRPSKIFLNAFIQKNVNDIFD